MIAAHWVAIGVAAAIIAVETFVFYLLRWLRQRSGSVRQMLTAGIGILCVAGIGVMVWILGLDQTDTIISVVAAVVPVYLFFSAALLRPRPDGNGVSPPGTAPRTPPPPP
ncbi:hypothetical protein [Catenuloplanes indicus]|uniref:Membrane protein YfcA n=1 Tax=Catenuloplanes indicus TaxID=137267 RepID=A0AAE3VX21_9ACTN|nr:hypothetical protein [Catenuloplanes indicus]MDQ0365588.1 putative membrane protein YfcA [Catenuloplanes indicus]